MNILDLYHSRSVCLSLRSFSPGAAAPLEARRSRMPRANRGARMPEFFTAGIQPDMNAAGINAAGAARRFARYAACGRLNQDWEPSGRSGGMKGLFVTACARAAGLQRCSASRAFPRLPAAAPEHLQRAGRQRVADRRRASSFIGKCLSGKPATTLTPRQRKMVTCNDQAASQNLSGDARRQFIGECLKS